VSLHWLRGEAPTVPRGITWGVPWPKGELDNVDKLTFATAENKPVPAQHWVTARWSDGSVKWSAHAASVSASEASRYVLLRASGTSSAQADGQIVVTQHDEEISVDTGGLQYVFPKAGNVLVKSISNGKRVLAADGHLVLQWQNTPEPINGEPLESDSLESEIHEMLVEHVGPMRAVIKATGIHRSQATGRELLPFTLRFYCYLHTPSLRLVHTLVYDADEYKDFISGIGLRFAVPMVDELHNRHVRFCSADGGVFAEAVRGLTGLRRDPGRAVRKAQVAGQATPPVAEFNPVVANGLQYIPAFGDYTLCQNTPDGFEIRKRTGAGHGWIASAYGDRSVGVGYIGGASGGLAFGIRNFWQSFPAQVDIRHAHTEAAALTLWLWSPSAPAMDLRFYHDGMGQDTYAEQLGGLDITYEDYEPEFGTPQGIARTSEVELWAMEQTPRNNELADIAEQIQDPSILVCEPAYYERCGVFGKAFSAAPATNEREKMIEKQLDFYVDYYKRQIAQHRWYGFWNYGDVMHTYDGDRHMWRYDVGGYAWDNSELSTDLWLWYYFLRSGRHDVFRMAEAMTRHTGEVDVHHIGRFAPLGSRHNVLHWGCSAKQLRISTVINRRFFYYLTADERVGDLMREQIDGAEALKRVVPGRKVGQVAATDENKVSVSFGTDWGSLAAAWFTEWERTADERMKNRLIGSMESIGRQPRGFFTGTADMQLESGVFDRVKHNAISVSHLSAAFGLAEICAELIDAFDVPEFTEAWLQYCIAYNAGSEWQEQHLGRALGKLNLEQGHSRLTAYAGWFLKNRTLQQRAWDEFYAGGSGLKMGVPEMATIAPPEVLSKRDEAPAVSTNAVAQWSLAAMQCMAYAGEAR